MWFSLDTLNFFLFLSFLSTVLGFSLSSEKKSQFQFKWTQSQMFCVNKTFENHLNIQKLLIDFIRVCHGIQLRVIVSVCLWFKKECSNSPENGTEWTMEGERERTQCAIEKMHASNLLVTLCGAIKNDDKWHSNKCMCVCACMYW